MGENWKVLLEAVIDQSSLTNAQKELAKRKLKIGIDVDVNQERLDRSIQTLGNSMLAFRDANTKMSKDMKSRLDQMYNQLINGANLSQKEVDQLRTSFSKLKLEVRDAGMLGKSFGDKMKNAMSKFGEWGFATGIVTDFTSKIRGAITELKGMNTLLTEVSKADDTLSKSELARISDSSFDVASDYGKKASNYLSGVREASRAGYENAEAIAEMSIAIQGAGDVSEDTANKYVIATDKAYGLKGSVEELKKVFDGTNYITNKNAVNMTELAEGMSIVGSTASSLGVEVNETTAVLGTMIASTQQSGSEMARAFRAILLNIRQVSDEEEGINAEGLTKYEKACNALNVKLKETKNGVQSLRDPMEVLRELSVEYNKLDEGDVRRTELLNSVGGKLRANALDAILKNYDMYSKMLNEYANGTGSMAREAEKTAQSWEGSLNRLSNTWTDTVENIADSDAIIGGINTLNGLLSIVNDITDALGSWGTIGLGAGLFAGIKNVGGLKFRESLF